MGTFLTDDERTELSDACKIACEKGLNQRKMAKATGLSTSKINGIIKNKRKNITCQVRDTFFSYFYSIGLLEKKTGGDGRKKDLPTNLAEEYYCLFPKTWVKDKDKTGYNTGTLKINKKEGTAYFSMQVAHEEYEEKHYKGSVIFKSGDGYNNIHIHLSRIPYPANQEEYNSPDVSYILFKYVKKGTRRYDFIIALILTSSAGNDEHAQTVHRMALCTKPFEENTRKTLLPFLKLSGDEFYIKESDFAEIEEQYGEELKKQLENKKTTIYFFNEAEIKSIIKNKNEEQEIISMLRDKSLNSLQYDQILIEYQDLIRDVVFPM